VVSELLALVALVAVVAFPVILIHQVPLAHNHVLVGASVIPYPAIVVGLLVTQAHGTMLAVAAVHVILIHAVPANIFVGSILQVYIQLSFIFVSLTLTLLNQVLFIISHVFTSQEDRLIISVA